MAAQVTNNKEIVAPRELRGLAALAEERPIKRALYVSLEPGPRRVGRVRILPSGSLSTRCGEAIVEEDRVALVRVVLELGRAALALMTGLGATLMA
jgi:hypothetical protein